MVKFLKFKQCFSQSEDFDMTNFRDRGIEWVSVLLNWIFVGPKVPQKYLRLFYESFIYFFNPDQPDTEDKPSALLQYNQIGELWDAFKASSYLPGQGVSGVSMVS